MDEPKPETQVKPSDIVINTLSKIQAEIDDDLTAGRMTPDDYQYATERIRITLANWTRPPDPGQGYRVAAIPNKTIDTQKLAQAYWLMANRLARERRASRQSPDSIDKSA